jgi:ribosome biogenesis GTPase
VVALQANFCLVALDQPPRCGSGPLLCTPRRRLAKSGQRILVGDRVAVEGLVDAGERGVVVAVAPRSSRLARPAVANVSRVVVMVALSDPEPDPMQLTRFLVTAEADGLPVLLVLSKADLLPAPAVEAWCRRTEAWGYDTHAISTRTGIGLEALRDQLRRPGLSVLCGPSGVGKSSLLNALRPDLQVRTGAVSGRLRKGRHTTRHVELFLLGPAALVADTPGFNRPELPADPVELAMAFPELRAGAGSCRFRDCRHLEEPGCAAGADWDRYSLYRQCLEEVLQPAGRSQRPAATRSDDTGLRQRGDRMEPRLKPSLRQSSRRRGRQAIASEALNLPPSLGD